MKLDWKSALGIALSVAMLWWTLRGQSMSDVWGALQQSNVLLFFLSVVVGTCMFPLRARRWQTILEPSAGVIPFGPLWRSTAIGMMMNNVFPFRAGEFARAYALTREVPRVHLTTALGSLAVDRVFDAIVLLALMFGAMLDPAFPSGTKILGRTVPEAAAGGIAAVVGVLVVCYFVVLQNERVMQFVGWFARKLVPKYEASLVRIVEHGVGGLAVLKDSRRFLAVLFWALLHWLVQAVSFYLAFLAIGIDAPFTAALFLQGVLGFGVSIPSSPGFFGVFELVATLGLGVYGVPKDLAFSWAIGYHILTFIPITVMGGVYFARMGLSVGAVAGAKAGTTA